MTDIVEDPAKDIDTKELLQIIADQLIILNARFQYLFETPIEDIGDTDHGGEYRHT